MIVYTRLPAQQNVHSTEYYPLTNLRIFSIFATGLWFSPGTPVSSTNKAGRHDITEILLKVVLNTTNQTNNLELSSVA